MLAEITPQNAHAEVSFGKPVGKEVLDWHRAAMCLMPEMESDPDSCSAMTSGPPSVPSANRPTQLDSYERAVIAWLGLAHARSIGVCCRLFLSWFPKQILFN
jgi:hypothetical protein